MTEFRKVDNLRHRCYRWLCVECNKTFDYAARTYIGAPNARAVSPVYCPECGACDFVRSAKLDVVTVHVDLHPLEGGAEHVVEVGGTGKWQSFEPRMSMIVGEQPLQPCAVCGERTPVYCLQCAAGTTAMTHVCLRDTCQRAHARNRHNAAGIATGEWTRSDSVAPTLQTMGEPQTAAEVSVVPRVTNKIVYGQCCICAAFTEFACSDCRIYTEHGVYVCNYGTCQRAHERTHKETSEDV
jgi:hypothetical protein